MALVQRRAAVTPLITQPEFFSDFTSDFEIGDVRKDMVRLTNEEAVKSSIRNLLLTNRGDRLFNPTLGSDIRSLMFENASPVQEQLLVEYITKTIENYEPRANLLSVQVNTEIDQHAVYATIAFSIINKQEPVVFDLILNRIR